MQGKILIVDAIATNRIVLKVKLASAFYQVMQADTVAQAREIACRDAPDLIICAASLPGDEGAADLCEALKNDPLAQHIPVLAIDTAPTAQDRSALLRAGVRDVLGKPVDVTLLLGRVRSLIRAYNTSAEWRMHEDTSAVFGLADRVAEF